ncbi:hypothetical protein M407DRAFT_241315 [Tulasnella calospora MUT 4182]|uniref:C2H2-type domain-containing protein n=1 Tax=Tulasnella calospora MUT 4182 TaxID=1051891 RepID=A0A0C3MFU5_9AGAM|nr:hypothetical protein M407DRAFT_241315 [Tulasnella calospora MUT 4182]
MARAKPSVGRKRRPARSKCRYCPKTYCDRRARKAHENAEHTNARLFTCEQCTKSFLYGSSASRCRGRHARGAIGSAQPVLEESAAPTPPFSEESALATAWASDLHGVFNEEDKLGDLEELFSLNFG